MSDVEKLEKLRLLLDPADTTSDEIVYTYLDMAEKAVVHLAFPFGDGSEAMPDKYEEVQLEIAVYLLNKRGAEGETIHVEGGTHRHYESADLPYALRSRIVPQVGGF